MLGFEASDWRERERMAMIKTQQSCWNLDRNRHFLILIKTAIRNTNFVCIIVWSEKKLFEVEMCFKKHLKLSNFYCDVFRLWISGSEFRGERLIGRWPTMATVEVRQPKSYRDRRAIPNG